MVCIISCKEKEKPQNISENIKPIDPEKITLSPELINTLDDSIKLYYKKNNYQEIWFKQENRTDLINEIKNSNFEGLNPEDYQLKKIEELETKRSLLSDNEISKYDIILTENFKKLAQHLYRGKINPQEVYKDWDITKKDIPLSDSLTNSIEKNRIKTLFQNLKPNHWRYTTIKNSLILLDKFPKYTFKDIVFTEKIEVNDTLKDVISIKERLKYWNDYTRKDSIITPIYDSVTVSAVKKFQKRHGLKPDGVIGKGTIQALNFSKEERRKQILANLERWKWFPQNFGEEYIMVNLPDYSLEYVIDNDTVASHTVVVGKKDRRTPILASTISNLVFNPTWTVPPTIIKEDLTPSATRNRSYFTRNKMTIYDASGKVVSPGNWNPTKARTYRYVQAPSYNNSLGVVKFNFPNKHAVYLHDTNHRDFFTREFKALSSGCVRVEKPVNLAKKILEHEQKEEDWNISEVDSILSRKNTKVVSVKHHVNVYLFYWTNWSEKNQLIFREDIYGLDNKLYEALRN